MKEEVLFTRQFEIYEVDLSDMKMGILPCIIIQNDIGNRYSPTTIVMPLVRKKIEQKGLYFKIKLKNLGELYVCASYMKVIDKSRLSHRSPIDIIEDRQIINQIERFYFANAGLKVELVNGERRIEALSDEELNFFYKEAEEC